MEQPRSSIRLVIGAIALIVAGACALVAVMAGSVPLDTDRYRDSPDSVFIVVALIAAALAALQARIGTSLITRGCALRSNGSQSRTGNRGRTLASALFAAAGALALLSISPVQVVLENARSNPAGTSEVILAITLPLLAIAAIVAAVRLLNR